MTGRINLAPEGERQPKEIDDRIAKAVTTDISRRFVPAVLEHIDGIPTFPLAGRARDDVRPSLRPQKPERREQSMR